MKKITYSVLCLSLSFAFLACQDESQPEPSANSDLIEVASTSSQALNTVIKVYSEEALKVGYNELQVALLDADSNDTLTDQSLSITPMMTMPTMSHSAPVVGEATVSKGMYRQGIVFIMPSGDMGSWELELDLEDPSSNQSDEVKVGLEIALPDTASMTSMISQADGSSVFATFIAPENPKVGMNEFQILLHKRENMMSYPAIEDYQVSIEPEMPTMGHGSDGNINPVHTKDGIYAGQLSFNMPGYWVVNVEIKNGNGEMVGTTKFELTF